MKSLSLITLKKTLLKYFVRKENKNNDLIQQFVSSTSYVVYICDTLQKGRQIVEQSCYFSFFVHKKYSCNFVKLRLNH